MVFDTVLGRASEGFVERELVAVEVLIVVEGARMTEAEAVEDTSFEREPARAAGRRVQAREVTVGQVAVEPSFAVFALARPEALVVAVVALVLEQTAHRTVLGFVAVFEAEVLELPPHILVQALQGVKMPLVMMVSLLGARVSVTSFHAYSERILSLG